MKGSAHLTFDTSQVVCSTAVDKKRTSIVSVLLNTARNPLLKEFKNEVDHKKFCFALNKSSRMALEHRLVSLFAPLIREGSEPQAWHHALNSDADLCGKIVIILFKKQNKYATYPPPTPHPPPSFLSLPSRLSPRGERQEGRIK